MSWDSELLNAQRKAASHLGSHACLRAGPGTGKTLTLCRRIVYLIVEQEVLPSDILALTFTRAAAHELRQRVQEDLHLCGKDTPRISTLHSFALRQLLRNSHTIATVPSPLRIADDWEERQIILEDLKTVLSIDLRETRMKFNLLSSDWQTLKADQEDWEERYPEPEFLGAWRNHSKIYGYTLRSQLVYELKRALEQNPNFRLEQSFKYLLVDEYQDLNRCDLAIVRALVAQGAELFATGDDDQSIYGFRFAHPEGIRRFEKDYSPSSLLELEYCKRCDKKILDIGLFVANLDPQRIKKPLKAMPDAGEGEVQMLWFNEQDEEADAIARICRHFIQTNRRRPEDILILLRSDYQGVFSGVLRQSLDQHNIPVACKTDYLVPLDWDEGRELLSILRLCANREDHLAWRTLLQLPKNHVGVKTIAGVYDLAFGEGITFANALEKVKNSPECLPRLGNRLATVLGEINQLVNQFDREISENEELMNRIRQLAERAIPSAGRRSGILDYLQRVAEASEAETLSDLLSALSASMDDKEQEIDHEKVNILTMHKAKGLTADAVFLVGAEDEYIPGNQVGEEEGDARRLLYVSLTRARHALFVTYCKRRTGRQKYTGSKSGKTRRTLSKFLADTSVAPRSGTDYLRLLGEQDQ